MKVVLLHLSDIHISSTSDFILQRPTQIAATTFKYLSSAAEVFVVVSGDIAQSGKAAEYELAEIFLRKLEADIKNERDIPINFIFVPGNHDCDFDKSDGVRKALISSVVAEGGANIDDSILNNCTSVQVAFTNFRNKFELSTALTFKDQLIREFKFNIQDKSIVFDCVNAAWMCQLDDPPGQLIFPVDKYPDLEERDADIRVVVLHHPLNWYSQASYQRFRYFVRKLANIVISGHEHSSEIGEIDDAKTSQSVYIEAGALQEHGKPNVSIFNVVTIDLETSQYLCEPYKWQDKLYKVEPSPNQDWSTYRTYHAKSVPGFKITSEFLSVIADPGGPFRHPSKDRIQLGDIYVHPDLRISGEEKAEKNKDISSDRLLGLDFIKQGVVIRGSDKCGKTSLLYQLYSHYFHQSMIPVLLSDQDISRFTEDEVHKAIYKAVGKQYGPDSVELFQQTSRNKKLLLLDDLDEIGKNPKHRASVIQILLNNFECIVATSSDLFEVSELLSAELAATVADWNQYQILPFGHKLRLDLIRRWETLGGKNEATRKETVGNVDKAEKLLNAVVGKQVVPCVPFYLLTLLQSFEASQQGELQNSAFGYYYQYLITQSMGRVSIKREQLDEFFNYCCQVAWFFNGQRNREATPAELREFNRLYSEKYYSVEFDGRIQQLVASEILEQEGQYLRFRYPYYYYFFLGKYLAENISDQAVADLIRHHSNHLYVSDYANIILFLSHHSKNRFVCDCVIEVIKGLFTGKNFMRFEEDTQLLNDLVDSAPRIVFGGSEDVIENRRQARELQDQAENTAPPRPLPVEQGAEKLDLTSKINLMFKTAEILGQVLKNHYGSLPNETKRQYLHEIFQGPLRGLTALLEATLGEQDALVRAVQVEMEKKGGSITEEDRLKIAKRSIFDLSSFISFVFIKKISDAINSENLREVIHAVTQENPSNAYKLVELTVRLDSPDPIPFRDIEQIKDENAGNLFLQRMLQAQAIVHIYMFDTTEQDKQRLADLLKIQIKQQHLVDMKTKDTKKLSKRHRRN
jgi:hypothetical protein